MGRDRRCAGGVNPGRPPAVPMAAPQPGHRRGLARTAAADLSPAVRAGRCAPRGRAPGEQVQLSPACKSRASTQSSAMQRVHTSNAHVRNTSKSTSGPVTHTRDPRKGHEQIETTTRIYLHADMTIKERALARTTPLGTTPGRYKPPDHLLAFLDTL
jgi:hypothetical protein